VDLIKEDLIMKTFMDIIFFLYFVSHIFITMLFDSQLLLPSWIYPTSVRFRTFDEFTSVGITESSTDPPTHLVSDAFGKRRPVGRCGGGSVTAETTGCGWVR